MIPNHKWFCSGTWSLATSWALFLLLPLAVCPFLTCQISLDLQSSAGKVVIRINFPCSALSPAAAGISFLCASASGGDLSYSFIIMCSHWSLDGDWEGLENMSHVFLPFLLFSQRLAQCLSHMECSMTRSWMSEIIMADCHLGTARFLQYLFFKRFIYLIGKESKYSCRHWVLFRKETFVFVSTELFGSWKIKWN